MSIIQLDCNDAFLAMPAIRRVNQSAPDLQTIMYR